MQPCAADPKTANLDHAREGFTGFTTDLPPPHEGGTPLPDRNAPSAVAEWPLSDLHGGRTVNIDEFTQPRWLELSQEQLRALEELDDAPVITRTTVISNTADARVGETVAQSEPVREITTGSVLRGRYVLGDILGRGGNCIVYQANDLHRLSADDAAGSQIAVKVLLPELRSNPHALKRMKREFRQMQCLTHPGIARVFDLDFEGDDWFMTMELVRGQTANNWMCDNDSSREALRVISACCDAMAHAHDLKILHGDLKPSNILIARDGSVKIIDFGSAPSPGARITQGGDLSLAATPSFASPQVLSGGIAEPRDDIFSLACLGYSILSRGAHPFARKSSLDACKENLRPEYVVSIPPRLFEVLVRGLSWDREQRPMTVRELLHSLIGSDLGRATPVARGASFASALREEPRGDGPRRDRTAQTRCALSESKPENERQTTVSMQLMHRGAPVAAQAAVVQVAPDTMPTPKAAGEPELLISDSLRDVEQLLHVDPESVAPMALPGQLSRFAGTSSLAAEYRRSLIVLAMVLAGTLFLARQAMEETSSPTPVPLAASTTPVNPPLTAPIAAPAIEQPVAEIVPVPVAAAVIRNAPGVITFDSPSLRAGSAQTLVAITLKRLQSTRGTARVAWRIDKGTARPGIDYVPVKPQVIKFFEGQPARSIFIPLVNVGRAAQGPRTFTVSLQKVTGGPVLGEISKVDVTIPSTQTAADALRKESGADLALAAD